MIRTTEKKGPRRDLSQVKVVQFSRTPSKYSESMPQQIFTMACLGLTIQQMADSAGVGLSTLEKWLHEKPEIRRAYDEGKWEADFGMELALRRKAMGYEYERTKEYSGVDSIGRPWSRTVTETVRVEPDTTALIFWHKNRNPERWKDSYNHQGGGTNIQVNNINMELFSDEEKKLARSMAIKQLEGMNVIAGS
jgi:hypothetical protein